MTENIKLQEFDPKWEEYFKEESRIVKNLLGANCVATVHVGSTAIKGMKARPMVDIMVLVKDIFDVDGYNEDLEKRGYVAKEQYGPLGRYLYEKSGDPLSYQLQFYENGDYDDIQKFVAFRDYVEANKEVAKEYISLKEKLAAAGDVEAYKKDKGEFVKKVLQDAISWHEMKHKKDMSKTIGVIFGVLMALLVGFVSKSILIGAGVGLAFALCVYFAFLGAMKKKKE